MKKLLLVAIFLAVALSASAFGFKIRLHSPGEGVMFFLPENQLETGAKGLRFSQGVSEETFHFDEEYLVFLMEIKEASLVRVDIVFLDEFDVPLPRMPVRLTVEGTFAGLRVRHPYWIDDEA